MLERLNNKRILVGVTGSIAAYKAGDIVRRLRDSGAEVRVVMTKAAHEFVTPMTFQALSGHPVYSSLLDPQAEAAMGHIELARWADAILIAPASADYIARLRLGRADDLLMAVCLASRTPLCVAPAMNQQMWADQATEDNIRTLRNRGILLLGPDSGEQACGDQGVGRMLEPLEICSHVAELFETGALAGLHVCVSAGPTREAIDPVRYLTNRSSGKMGYALAAAAVEAGARVTLVSGPVSITPPDGAKYIGVSSAQEMHDMVMSRMSDVDVFISAAAVADYRPEVVAEEKIKKNSLQMTLNMVRNPDILSSVKQRYPVVFCVGFAAETEQLEYHARKKLIEKDVELIAANWVGQEGQEGGFDSDVNALKLFWREGEQELSMAPKTKLARELISITAQRYQLRNTSVEKSDNILPFSQGKKTE